jgi:hypothetical protein
MSIKKGAMPPESISELPYEVVLDIDVALLKFCF